MGDRKYRFASAITAQLTSLFEEVAASCCEGFSHLAKLEEVERQVIQPASHHLLRSWPQYGARVAPLRCPILRLG